MTMQAELMLSTRGDVRRFGRRLGQSVVAGDILVLEGDLGAGKTFLSRAIARGLGVPASVPVCSPTFALVHELPGRETLLHVDLYRLSDAQELEELGLLERAGRDAVCVVEWGARFAGDLGSDRLDILLSCLDEPGRKVSLRATGPSACRLLRACVHADDIH